MHVKGVCMAWWLVMGYDQCDWSYALIILFWDCSFVIIVLFPIFQSYVNRLHRVSIGDGEIQGANGQGGQNKKDQWRKWRNVIFYLFFFIGL